MSQVCDIAVVGATGAVGEAMLSILAERKFPIGEIYALASHRSAGSTVMFDNKPLMVADVAEFDFSQVQIALFSAGGSASEKYAPIAVKAGCLVIDNSSQFRMDPEVPLIVPEVNAEILRRFPEKNIIANPNCSTIQMVMALKPIHDAVGISRINVATYQAVSGTGTLAIKELASQTAELLSARPIQPTVYPHQIAFNALPQIDVFMDNGYTKEEIKMVNETRKILEDEEIMINPTAVRVPVFYGHSEAIHIETKEKITVEQAIELLDKFPGVEVLGKDKMDDYPTAITHGANQDAVFVGRIREDISHPQGLDMWVVADNIRKGAALNAIQIAEFMLETHF